MKQFFTILILIMLHANHGFTQSRLADSDIALFPLHSERGVAMLMRYKSPADIFMQDCYCYLGRFNHDSLVLITASHCVNSEEIILAELGQRHKAKFTKFSEDEKESIFDKDITMAFVPNNVVSDLTLKSLPFYNNFDLPTNLKYERLIYRAIDVQIFPFALRSFMNERKYIAGFDILQYNLDHIINEYFNLLSLEDFDDSKGHFSAIGHNAQGFSGSPVFYYHKGEYKPIAVVSGLYREDSGYKNVQLVPFELLNIKNTQN